MEHCYLLCGPEEGSKGDFINNLKKSIEKEFGKNGEYYSYYAGETAPETVLEVLQHGALFSDWRFVRYLDADKISGKENMQLITQFIKNPAPAAFLILETVSYSIDKAIEEALAKEAKKTFWELSLDEAENWVQAYFKKASLEIENNAVTMLLELVGNNTEALKTECSRLALFYPPGSCITEDTIEQYIAHSRQEDVFTLFASLVENSFEHSLGILQTILSSKEANGISIISGLRWSFQRLASLHELIKSGKPFEQAARTLKITSRKMLSLYHKALREWTYAEVKELIAFSAEIDYQLRLMGTVLEQEMLELFLFSCKFTKKPIAISHQESNLTLQTLL
ncbi:MAG TPA: DNA polymerase III subunit delta [Spirochaetia bacterium]|nr:DNA polymerase III subunit delta [Spirochaetales bacterium]HPD80982.1 DNA polymerase III subunit delta [Spirochaetales bacterium]HQK34525.1 DNA polymerase III subunit delta [Spirochaetales bacterium]HRS65731.1 DNA polymerase III subunit delta [Spirochaetia bacterium]HRV29677.1 DNA polymerase III subunit delta [Spirochaetia bacterium]